ncbi:MAG TPA: alkaline phosphatase family protein, partial [Chitinophagaceae bacterium]|nr:alkaline phosphatase family protein [Chitinophagaceae bacterium]
MKFVLLPMLLFCFTLQAQPKRSSFNHPKLVVGIVIDQMRYDFLYRYQERYSSGGFQRLLREGHSCENTFINYLP